MVLKYLKVSSCRTSGSSLNKSMGRKVISCSQKIVECCCLHCSNPGHVMKMCAIQINTHRSAGMLAVVYYSIGNWDLVLCGQLLGDM